jgi:hypothetical protein
LSAIKEKIDFHVILRPSKDGEPPGALSSALRRLFTSKLPAEQKMNLAPVDIEEIQGLLPPGKSVLQ